METGKKAVETVKEATANIGASANSGMEKSKALVQEKIDKMSAKDDYEKGIATEVKDQRITEAELHKQQVMSHNAAEKDAKIGAAGATQTGGGAEPELHKQHHMDHDDAEKDARDAVAENKGIGVLLGTETGAATGSQYSHSTTGATLQPTGAHQMSTMPGHGSGESLGEHVVEGTQLGSHPIGKATETNSRTTMAQNRHVGGGTGPGYTGTGYSS